MLHWKTREEMGGGFMFNKSDHSDTQYNSLQVVQPHEKNTMRTKYLVRDWWSKKTINRTKRFYK